MSGINFTNCRTSFSASYSGEIEAAKITGISGASGSGKSTLLKIIADLLPYEGEVTFNGMVQSETEPRTWRKKVRFIHEHSLWWKPLVSDHFENIDERDLQLLGLSKSSSGMECLKLSTGENKRFGLLRGLQDSPMAVLLDEPTSNLDRSTKSLVIRYIQNYYTMHTSTMVVVSHDPELLAEISNAGVFDITHYITEKSLH